MSSALEPTAFLQSLIVPVKWKPARSGGQELILHEVVSALWGFPRVWVPFRQSCSTLAEQLLGLGYTVLWGDLEPGQSSIDSVYFGTPTIVHDRNLFPEKERWTKDKERMVVREIVRKAIAMGAQRIVSGLGSGDISIHERLSDMGGGEVVTWKQFREGDVVFQDWVLVRNVEFVKIKSITKRKEG